MAEFKLGSVALVIFRRSVRSTLLPVVLLTLIVACREIPETELTVPDESLNEWEQVFVGKKIDLNIAGPPLQYISRVVVSPQGDLFIPRDSGNIILRLSRNGGRIDEISADSAQPYYAFSVDPEGNFVFLGPGFPLRGRISVLSAEDGRVVRRFGIHSWPSAILPIENGQIVAYSAGGEPDGKRVFELFDRDGRRLAASHPVEDDAQRAFHGRVQTGGVIRTSSGQLVGIHPAKFELIRMSPELQVLEFLEPPRHDSSSSDPPPFPSELDPYDYQSPHKQWWDSFAHIGAPHDLGEDIFMVTLWRSHGMADTANFANLYRLPGAMLARGLRVPHEGRVVGAGLQRVYVARNAVLTDSGTTEPLELFEYTLREDLAQSWQNSSTDLPR